MSRLPLGRVALAPGLASCVVAALLLVARPVPVAAGQDDALRNRVVQLGQVTGDDAFKAQVADVLQDIDLAKKLVPVAVEMAQAKDSNLTYYGALTLAQ